MQAEALMNRFWLFVDPYYDRERNIYNSMFQSKCKMM